MVRQDGEARPDYPYSILGSTYFEGMNGKVILVTILSVKPGLEDLILCDLTPIIEATRQISGCLAFDLYRLATQH